MIYQLNYGVEYLGLGHVVPAKSKYADSKSSAYLRGTWLKTKKYQTVILAYLRYVSTRIRDLTILGRQRNDDGQNKLLQINGSKDNSSYIINRMNLIQS
jgi:hypothetical protein